MKISDMGNLNYGLALTDIFPIVRSAQNYKATIEDIKTLLLTNTSLEGNPTCPTPLTDSGVANKGYVDSAVSDMWKENTSSQDGYVLAGTGNGNKVWGTDALGNPSWRDNIKTGASGVSGTKLYLVGTQAAPGAVSAQTYTNANTYIGTDNNLYSHGERVATLNSPLFTGFPSAPTADTDTDDTQIATTAFVHNVVEGAMSQWKGKLLQSGIVTPSTVWSDPYLPYYNIFFAQAHSSSIGGVAIGYRWSATNIRWICWTSQANNNRVYTTSISWTMSSDGTFPTEWIIRTDSSGTDGAPVTGLGMIYGVGPGLSTGQIVSGGINTTE